MIQVWVCWEEKESVEKRAIVINQRRGGPQMLTFLIKRENPFITSPSKEIIRPITRFLFRLTLLSLALLSSGLPSQAEVKELAPGVYFREGDITKGLCNNGWIIFEDYVLVIDANFPQGAEQVLADIRKRTSKPIRFVFDTHYHADHSFGNVLYTQKGAVAVANEHCLLELHKKGLVTWRSLRDSRPDLRNRLLKNPSLVFPEKLVLKDSKTEVDLLHFGPGHTLGDAVAYLPKEKILFTGDLCVNGPYNYLGDADTAHWIQVLKRLEQRDVRVVAPGHGPLGTSSLLRKQREYLEALRSEVQRLKARGLTLEQIQNQADLSRHKPFVIGKANRDHIAHVYRELAQPAHLRHTEGKKPVLPKDQLPPKLRFLIPPMSPEQVEELMAIAPNVEILVARTPQEALRYAPQVDGCFGFASREFIRSASRLKWIQAPSAGVEGYLQIPEIRDSAIVLTNARVVYGPEIADHIFAMLLALTRGLNHLLPRQTSGQWGLPPGVHLQELQGKTMLIVGLGGIGRETARRASGFGMRVLAVDPEDIPRPPYVEKIVKPSELYSILPQAEVVVSAAPLTEQTRKMFNEQFFSLMKPGAYFINVSRGGLCDTPALVKALQKGSLAGAGLDVTDPEPLPQDHPLWRLPNVIITPHIAGRSPEGSQRLFQLLKENLRRFAQGEPLLNVVDKQKGY